MVAQLNKKFAEFYETRWFVTASTRARHQSLLRAPYIQSTHNAIPFTSASILIVPSHSTQRSYIQSPSFILPNQTLRRICHFPHARHLRGPPWTGCLLQHGIIWRCKIMHNVRKNHRSITTYTEARHTSSNRSSTHPICIIRLQSSQPLPRCHIQKQFSVERVLLIRLPMVPATTNRDIAADQHHHM